MIKFWHKHHLLPRSLALPPYTRRPPGLPSRPTSNRTEIRPCRPGVKALPLGTNHRNPHTKHTPQLALFPQTKPEKSQAESNSQACSPVHRECLGS